MIIGWYTCTHVHNNIVTIHLTPVTSNCYCDEGSGGDKTNDKTWYEDHLEDIIF